MAGREMESSEESQVQAERSFGLALIRWAPAITAIIAAVATILVALISWNASRSATDKDYVSLAMSILSAKDSTTPSRRWAVQVLSRLSPVDIPKELASGLITGRSVIPSELDPTATRQEILTCLKPILESDVVKPVENAPIWGAKPTVGDLAVFADHQTGQLDKANDRIKTLRAVLDICISPPRPKS
jgi:hypothetical protein